MFYKTQHLFMVKTLQKVDLEGIYLNIIKPLYDKIMANIVNTKKLKVFL